MGQVDSWMLIIGAFVILLTIGGFFMMGYIKNQISDLKNELLKTAKEKKSIKKYKIEEGVARFMIKGNYTSENEKNLLVGELKSLQGVLDIKDENGELHIIVDILKRSDVMEALESFRTINDMKFFIVVME